MKEDHDVKLLFEFEDKILMHVCLSLGKKSLELVAYLIMDENHASAHR